MSETTCDYSHRGIKEAFAQLLEADQQIPIDNHSELANQLQLTQLGVNTTMDTYQKTKEIVSDVVELDSENYGAPSENSGIEVNAKNASLTEPQAWEDEHGNWFYNFAGALQLAKALGRTLPNIYQLIASIDANPDNFRQYAGYRLSDGRFTCMNKFSDFWSLSEHGSDAAYFACLEQ